MVGRAMDQYVARGGMNIDAFARFIFFPGALCLPGLIWSLLSTEPVLLSLLLLLLLVFFLLTLFSFPPDCNGDGDAAQT